MRIVNRKTFLQMPKGTVYAKYQPRIFSEIFVKYSDEDLDKYNWGNDWWSCAFDYIDGDNDDTIHKRFALMESDMDASFPVGRAANRDGLFDDSQMFAIYEKSDIEYIIKTLKGIFNDE